MDKEKALEIIKLLSAIESAAIVAKVNLPDYLYEQISKVIEDMTQEVLK